MPDKFFEAVEKWAQKVPHIESVIVVGSYARGENRSDSDIDLCIITSNRAELIENQDFAEIFGDIEKKQTEYYGACTSVRVWYRDEREVEFGIVAPSWIERPLDAGTQKVLSDGYRVIVDKKNHFGDIY